MNHSVYQNNNGICRVRQYGIREVASLLRAHDPRKVRMIGEVRSLVDICDVWDREGGP